MTDMQAATETVVDAMQKTVGRVVAGVDQDEISGEPHHAPIGGGVSL